MLNIDTIEIKGIKHKYKIYNNIGYNSGKIDLVIELGLGAVIGEWDHIGKILSKNNNVLIYERSRQIDIKRTPINIANELYELLKVLDCAEKIIIIGHSQGGLYASQFARLYPDMIKGLILLDPLSPIDNQYKVELNSKEQKMSGFDKSKNLVIMKFFAKLHLGFLIKKIMRKAPPFYYYDYSKDATDYILDSIIYKDIYESSIDEYKYAHDEEFTLPLKDNNSFPNIPLVLITHSTEYSEKEIEEFGQTTKEFAHKVEELWQSIMKVYLNFSNKAVYKQARNSGHYIHLNDLEIIIESISLIK